MKNFKTKWDNYWYYHKGATILAIVFIFGIVLFFVSNDETLPSDGRVQFITTAVASEKSIDFDEAVSERLTDANNDGIRHLEVSETWIAQNPESDKNAASSIQQIVGSFSAGKTGLYIFDKINLDRFMAYDAFEPLENVLPSPLLDGRESFERDGKIMAVRLSDSALLKSNQVLSDELYAAVIFSRPDGELDEQTAAGIANTEILLEELLK